MATFSVRVTGTKQTKRNLLTLGKDAPKVVGGALFREAERIMAEIKTVPIVPVDLGTLSNTGHVVPPEIDSRGATVIMAFGGPAARYALAIHEGFRTTKTGRLVRFTYRIGQAKYLSEPVNRNLPAIGKAMGTAVDTAVRRLPKK